MRVRVGTTYLAGDPALGDQISTQAQFLHGNSPRVFQTLTGPQKANPAHHHRGNRDEFVEFETTREFSDYPTMWDFFFYGWQALPRTGDVEFLSDTGGTTYMAWLMPGCIISPPERVPMGIALKLRYRIQGAPAGTGIAGDYTATPAGGILDESGAQLLDEDGNPLIYG